MTIQIVPAPSVNDAAGKIDLMLHQLFHSTEGEGALAATKEMIAPGGMQPMTGYSFTPNETGLKTGMSTPSAAL